MKIKKSYKSLVFRVPLSTLGFASSEEMEGLLMKQLDATGERNVLKLMQRVVRAELRAMERWMETRQKPYFFL